MGVDRERYNTLFVIVFLSLTVYCNRVIFLVLVKRVGTTFVMTMTNCSDMFTKSWLKTSTPVNNQIPKIKVFILKKNKLTTQTSKPRNNCKDLAKYQLHK